MLRQLLDSRGFLKMLKVMKVETQVVFRDFEIDRGIKSARLIEF